jgi:RNA polymerase sigma-70 factor, ECF subfamily
MRQREMTPLDREEMMGAGMDRKRHLWNQQGHERGDNKVSSWPRGRCLMRQRLSIQTREPAGVAALEEHKEIDPSAKEDVLLTAARIGHPTAFSDLIQEHTGRLRRMAFRITRNREDAEDVLQDCLKNALIHLDTFRGQSQFSTWITRIALNAALMKIRQRHRELRVDDTVQALKWDRIPSPNPTPEQSYCRVELESILTDEIARLKPSLRGPVVLCHMEGRIAQDAAKALGISNSAFKARLRRARLVLRFRLERLGIGKSASANRRRVGSNFFCHDRGSPGLFAPTAQNANFGD